MAFELVASGRRITAHEAAQGRILLLTSDALIAEKPKDSHGKKGGGGHGEAPGHLAAANSMFTAVGATPAGEDDPGAFQGQDPGRLDAALGGLDRVGDLEQPQVVRPELPQPDGVEPAGWP